MSEHFFLWKSLTKLSSRILVITALMSGNVLPVLADQNSPTPGTAIENQATAQFTDAADNSTQTALSNKVVITVAEVAGITASNTGVTNSAYRTNTIYFDYIVTNAGNDPTQFFIPAQPSSATIAGVALPAANIGQLQVIEYNNVTTTTPVTTGNLVNTTTGSTTGSLSGIPNSGSVPAGGYVKVRIPIIVPAGANIGDVISVTLGNTGGQPSSNNTPYVVGANGTGTNDLYTQDNTNGTSGEFSGVPVNGDTTNHRQEASSTQTTPVVAPPNITISGTVWDDANGSGTATFTAIQNGAEAGANTSASTPPLNAILVDSAGNVVATTPVNTTNGTYTLSGVPGVQNGVYVILSTSTGTVGQAAPAPSLPTGWAGTTPLTYSGANAFNIGITNVTGKDFGIDLLPTAVGASSPTQVNPTGTNTVTVPTTLFTGSTDLDPNGTGGVTAYKITAFPTNTTSITINGTNYTLGTFPATGVTITTAQLSGMLVDPIDGGVTVSIPFQAIDAAGKLSTNTANAVLPFGAAPVTISGTVWNDKDNSANGTFTNIQTGSEVGTNAVFGTTTTPDNVILVDTTTGNVLASQVLPSSGAFSFTNVPANTNVSILLSPTAGTVGSAPPAAAAPTGWVATSPQTTATFNTGLFSITGKDFGIRQKAKFVLLKQITKVNGLTTNPNDGTVLNGATTDTYNTGVNNWPSNYLFGVTNAGVIKPGDTIEYTVYFLNNQGADATSVNLCDPIRGAQTYVPSSLKLQLGNSASATALTDAADADSGQVYAAGAAPTNCNASASTATGVDNGGVAVGIAGAGAPLTAVPGATAAGTPTQSYGLFRFTTQVKP